ncbi:MAG: glycosyltransferase family 4 protein [Candidatus Methanoplasma sp.]|jgi:glycosyltransferase involved in cell wall biosynthesis|nr:glycosyltransferase family 4 protein [Candidatus Methanoplasma sp.]
MEIVDVNPFFYPFRGGIEHRIHDTSRLLAAGGHKVTVLTGRLPDTPEEEEADGYRIIRLKSRLVNIYNPPFISTGHVLEAVKSIDPDIVNYNYRWAPSYNDAMRKYDGKKVFTYHNMWGEGVGIQGFLSGLNDFRFKKCLDTFDHIISVSDHVRDDLVRRGYPGDHVTSVPTGISSFPDRGEGNGDFILSLGRLVRTKGLDCLIDAMRDVDCKLIICGKGPDERRLKRRIERNGLEGRIELRGWVSDDEKNMLMRECKIFVMPSLFESFGLAAVEAMSYGRPLVCSDVNGLPKTVGDGGVCVPPGSASAISAAVNMLLGDDEKRKRLGENAALQAQAYQWGPLISKIEEVYEKVLL